MDSNARIARLRSLARQLERRAASAEHDAILRATRDRIVELEIGLGNSSAWSRRPRTAPVFLDPVVDYGPNLA